VASKDATTAKENEEARALDMNVEMRRILNNAYAFVAGQRNNQTFAATTYEELAKKQIDRITGPGTEARPNELQRLEKMKSELVDLVEQVKEIPPDRFLVADSRTDVNTPPEVEDV
jgi:hypothetical protein